MTRSPRSRPRRGDRTGRTQHYHCWPKRLAFAILIFLVAGATGACSAKDDAQGDVYQLVPTSCSDQIPIRATATAVGHDLVATAAHSFERAAGAMLRDADGNEQTAEVVYADFDKDIALLRVDPPNKQVFIGAEPEDGSAVRFISYSNAESGPETKKATVVRTVRVTLDGEGRRRAIELEADIERGDSGGPVLDNDGRAVGMVFASSRSGERGWAVTFDEIEAAMNDLGEGADLPLPIQCDS